MNQIVIDNMVNQNNVIQDEQLRKMMHETFDNIFKYLGKENFLRWINIRNLSSRIKKLAIEEFSKEDKEEKSTACAGFYTRGTDRIKLRDKEDINSNIHETYHFISDGNEWFPTFINEGLTEYLNMNTLSGSKSGYMLNVSVVKFLHNVLGDSLIKAYLTGNVSSDKKFIEYFSSYVSNDRKADLQKLQDFYKNLDIIHNLKVNPKEKADDTTQSKLDNAFEKTAEYLQNIVSNYIKKKAQNLDYYAFGKLDFVAIKQDIRKMNALLKPCFAKGDYSKIENNITKRALTAIIENSHLAVETDNKDKLISDIIGQIFRESQVHDQGNGVTNTTPGYIDDAKANELFNSRQSVTMDLAKLKLENNASISKDGKFNIVEFIRQVGNIQAATNMSKNELDTILGNYILQNCPAGIDVKRIETVIKDNITLIRNLDDIKFDREKNTVESTYFKVDNNRYIEKRDGRQFMVTIEPNGDIKDKPYNIYIDKVYSITPLGKNPRQLQNIGNIDDLKMDLIVDRLYRSIDSKQYMNILKDAPDPFAIKGVYYTKDVDMRSRTVDFSKYIADLKSILTILPEDRQDVFVNNSVTKLLRDIYGAPKEGNSDLYSQMQDDVKIALKAQKKEVFEKKIRDLNENTSTLNSFRRARVEEDKKYALIGFKTRESRIIYTINRNAMRKRQLEADEREFVKNSDAYILDKESLDKRELFPGLYVIGSWNCTFKSSIDINKMADGLKDFLKRYPEKERMTKAKELSRQLLRKYYGRETSGTIDGINNDRKSIYDGIQDMVCSRILDGKEIDLDNFHELEQNMHNIVSKEYDYANERSAVGFEDTQTRNAYMQYKDIQSRTDIPQDIKDSMLNQIKDSNKSRLESNKLLAKVISLTEGKCSTSQINDEVGKIRTIIQERNKERWH